ncbi:MAG: imelysin family protein [Saprospiraceae bacterium]
MKTLQISTLLAFVLFIAACTTDPNPTGCDTEFDQEAMFDNIAENLIIPAYTDLKAKVDDLQTKVSDFRLNPTQSNLDILRNSWFDAYQSWQVASQYEFGPAAVEFLFNSLNNFPLDTAIVNEKIQNADYDFSSPDAFDKGFPAMDYLLYGIAETDTEIINLYATTTTPTLHGYYLNNIINDIKSRVDNTYDAWTSGTYKSEFIANTGTAAGSSLSLIVNGFNQNYEYIKREKFGIPSGVLTLQFTNPTKVEAYYSGRSTELALTALEASQELYLGKDGLGLDDYLQAIGTMKNDKTLDAVIQEQFTSAISAIQDLGTSTPLSEIVENEPNEVVNVYNEVTKQLVNIKTDMPSVLCVSITYIDNPSDSD